MDYREARQYIEDAMSLGSVLGLDNIRTLLEKMGSPQNRVKIIHVAGTNGKGSVIAYLYSILEKSGYKVGRYISPAVFSYRERIQVNGEDIAENKFAGIVSDISRYIEEMVSDGNNHPTAFEIETAVAYQYFYDMNCDVAIVETGLGGREDATNVIESPLMCIITSISLDHTQILGNTIGEIAREKAGIIMEGTPVVMMNQQQEAINVVKEVADSRNSDIYITDKCYDILYDREGTSFSYEDRRYDTEMIGTFQPDNAAVAIESAHILAETGYNISERHIYEGIRDAGWPGRFEKISDKPPFYIDGAHNPDAAIRFADTLDKYFSGVPKVFVVGILEDKDYRKVCEVAAPYAERIITVTPDNPRALPGEILAEVIREYNENVEYVDNIGKAVKYAVKYAGKIGGIVIAFGSLSYLNDIKKGLR